MPKYRWLRWLTYLLVFWIALGISLAGGSEISSDYDLSTGQGLVAGLAQGSALMLALWLPAPAWALSLAATVTTALTVRPHLAETTGPDPSWPWSTPAVLAHSVVFLLLALRVPARKVIAALVVTGLATVVLQVGIDATGYSGTGTVAIALFAVAVVVGIALRGRREARTRLVEQETITAEERARRTLLEERSRIARELHDVVAHHMSVISIQAQVAPHLVEDPSEELKENLDGIRQNALEALTELRRVLGVLRSENPDDPYGLGEPGTGSAPQSPQPTLDRLDALIENTRAAGLRVATDIRGTAPPYPPGVELSAYRIIQEALSNALRHAPGSAVRVEITHFPRGLYLGVINSRPERPVPPSPGTGHGLLGMRERATMLGGHLTATPTLHGGFSVSAFLPRDGTADPDDTEPVEPDGSVTPVFGPGVFEIEAPRPTTGEENP
ncbi:sensor histidine kinase [Streptomyces sp. DG2A-72]|uniref:sensor histidine kinase n=1 Tax=Streptomyces sp. DG2A-72 TaxID=3051386 RepID=UPI00265B8414|nr:sensor histidine kinase [Streptomyces sp. DG2A-72]MDO0935062.1 sensor histidine kinase [Streptomyces sp. DG2A-72]